jgi:hypothetical protein
LIKTFLLLPAELPEILGNLPVYVPHGMGAGLGGGDWEVKEWSTLKLGKLTRKTIDKKRIIL